MRAVVQRVSAAGVAVEGSEIARIGAGLCVLVAMAPTDGPVQVAWMADRVVGLRVFADDDGKMNRSIDEAGGSLLLVSQFTLYGDVSRGRRPSFTRSARAEEAEPLFASLVADLRRRLPDRVQTGVFGADMQVSLVNDGPVTLIVDSPSAPGAEA